MRDLPETLLVSLKRFKVTQAQYEGVVTDDFTADKVHTTVKFTARQILPDSIIADGVPGATAAYDLSSAMHHRGSSVRGGHCFSDALSAGGDWFRLDDTEVTPTSIADVTAGEGGRRQLVYMMSYRQALSGAGGAQGGWALLLMLPFLPAAGCLPAACYWPLCRQGTHPSPCALLQVAVARPPPAPYTPARAAPGRRRRQRMAPPAALTA